MKFQVNFYQREAKIKNRKTGRFKSEWISPDPIEVEGKDVRGPHAESDCYEIIGESQRAVAVFNAADVSYIIALGSPGEAKSLIAITDGAGKWRESK